MKYYAVTNDPTELMHYGIKGMKWGVIRTDAQLGHPRHTGPERPRSAAYKKASAKLGGIMKSGINKAKTRWNEYNSPENKAYREYKHEQNKAKRAYNRSERKFEKHMQKAREGTLKYKGISDSEVERITDRLALERNSRLLSGSEKPSYLRRLREAAGEGVLQGVTRGTSAYMEARWRGRGETTAEMKKDKRLDKYYGKTATQQRKQKRKIAEEYYDITREEGERPEYYGSKNRAKYIAEVKKRNKEKDYQDEIKRAYDLQDARNRANSDNMQRDYLRGKERNEQEAREARARQFIENNPQRALRPSGALERLNSYNEAHENYDEKANNYLISAEAQKEAQRQARLEAASNAERSAYRARVTRAAETEDAKRREKAADEAWKSKQKRLAEAREKETYEARLSKWAREEDAKRDESVPQATFKPSAQRENGSRRDSWRRQKRLEEIKGKTSSDSQGSAHSKRPGTSVHDWETLSRHHGESMEDYLNRVNAARNKKLRR